RVSDLLGAELSGIWGGTFHAIGARILRINAAQLGLRPDFSILDREDSTRLIKTCLSRLADHLPPRFDLKPEAIAALLSRAVNDRKSLSDLLDSRRAGASENFLDRISTLYTELKRASNCV